MYYSKLGENGMGIISSKEHGILLPSALHAFILQ
jgi:hypothetical protein